MPALGDFTIFFPIEGGLSTSFELTKKNGEESASIGVALFVGSLQSNFWIKSCYHTDNSS